MGNRRLILTLLPAKPGDVCERRPGGVASGSIHRVRTIFGVVVMLLAVLSIGCGGSGTSSNAESGGDSSNLLADLMGDIDLTDGRPAEPSLELNAKTEPAVPIPTEQNDRLELRLSTGDQFPLVKTVKQSLVQKSQQFPATANSELQMHMVLQVGDVQPDAILLQISYTRITYTHDINGQQFTFDTDSIHSNVTNEMAPYVGMVNNGFAFWLGRDNRIHQVVGYELFLQRCVQQVEPNKREAMLAAITARFGRDSVENFVDDAIGLLPFNSTVDAGNASRVAVGDVWTRERRLNQPTPIKLDSTCRLVSLDEKTAVINIAGRISPEQNQVASANVPGAVQITGGRSIGSCVVDRSTGLPLQLSRSRFLSMTATLADGQTVDQEKRVETSIQTFPNTRRPVVNVPSYDLRKNVGSTNPTGPISTQTTDSVFNGGLNRPRLTTRRPGNIPSGIRPVSGIQSDSGPIRRSPQSSQQPAFDTSQLQSTTTAVYPD